LNENGNVTESGNGNVIYFYVIYFYSVAIGVCGNRESGNVSVSASASVI
jgi:hypothetical protein